MSNVFSPSAYGGQLPFMQEDEDEDEEPRSNLDITFGDTSAGNQAGVIVQGEVESLNVRGGAGVQTVEIYGELADGHVDLGGGNDRITVHAGSIVDGVDFRLGDGDDRFRQEFGSAFHDVGVHGEDGGDHLYFAGYNEGTKVRPGKNEERPDVIALQDTVTGTLDFDDPENWTIKPKDDSEWGRDILQLVGDWRGRDAGRFDTNLLGGGGKRAYGDFERIGDDRVMADLDVIGDVTRLEYVTRVNEHGEMIGTLQSIDPEYEFENMWAKHTGQALVVLGTVIPGAQFLIPVGLGFQTAFEADNKIASFESTGLNMLQGAAGASGVGWLSQGVDIGASAYRGDYGGAALGVAGFMPRGGALQRGLGAGGTGYRAYQAAERGDIGGAITTAATVPGHLGRDSSGWIARGGSVAATSYGFGKALDEGDVDGILRHGTALPHLVGLDDDRTIMGVGEHARGLYRIADFEFGRRGNDLVTDLLDLAVGPDLRSGVVQDFARGDANLDYRAPPDVRVDEEGRLVFESPEAATEYADYVDRFRDEDGNVDLRALRGAIRDSHLSEPEQARLLGRIGTAHLGPTPPPGQLRAGSLPEGTVLVRAQDPITGRLVGDAVPEELAGQFGERLRQQGFVGVEIVEEAPPPDLLEVPEGHALVVIRNPATGETWQGVVSEENAGRTVEDLRRDGFQARLFDPAEVRALTGGEPSTAGTGGTSPSSDGNAQAAPESPTPEDATYEGIGSGGFQTGGTGTLDGEIVTDGAGDSDDAEALEPILPPEFHREESGGKVRPVPTDEENLQGYFDEVIERHTSEGMFDREAFESELRDSGLDPYEQFTVLYLLGERFETDPNAPDVMQPPLTSNSIDRPAGWTPPYESEPSPEPNAGDFAPSGSGSGAFGTAVEGHEGGFSGAGKFSFSTSGDIRFGDAADTDAGEDNSEAGSPAAGTRGSGDAGEQDRPEDALEYPPFVESGPNGAVYESSPMSGYIGTVTAKYLGEEGFDLYGLRQELDGLGVDEVEQRVVFGQVHEHLAYAHRRGAEYPPIIDSPPVGTDR